MFRPQQYTVVKSAYVVTNMPCCIGILPNGGTCQRTRTWVACRVSVNMLGSSCRHADVIPRGIFAKPSHVRARAHMLTNPFVDGLVKFYREILLLCAIRFVRDRNVGQGIGRMLAGVRTTKNQQMRTLCFVLRITSFHH